MSDSSWNLSQGGEPGPPRPTPPTARGVAPAVAEALAERFELGPELGRGAMGVVLTARERSTGRRLALKLTLGDLDTSRRLRFEREGHLLARLDHPGIVRVHAAGTAAGVPWLACELVEGARPLDRALQELPLRRRVELVRDLCRALGAAHARGVLHRDVKPGNALVDATGALRLTDFGLAGAGDLDRLTRSGVMIGTPSYMAPEQITAQRGEVGPWTDVWAAGVVLYQALTDALPFPASDLLQLAAWVCERPPTPPRELAPAVPATLEAICLAALEKEPARRPPHGDALADALDRWLADGTEGAGARPAAVAAAALLLVGVGAAAAIALALGPGPAPQPPAPSPRPARPDPAPTPAAPAAPLPAWILALPPAQRPPTPLPPPLRAGRVTGTFEVPLPGDVPPLVLVWQPPVDGVPGFFLGQDEVSADQFAAWERACGSPPPQDRSLAGFAQPAEGVLPAERMTWDEARDFCAWAGLRLPTRAEWLRAAGRESFLEARDSLVPADQGPLGASGCRHLADNVQEWVLDALDPFTPPQKEGPRRAMCGGSCLRGGSLAAASEADCVRERQWTPMLGLRVAGPGAPAPEPWRTVLVGFEPQDADRRGPPPGFEQLLAAGGPRLELELPRLDVDFDRQSPGALPSLRGRPGARDFPPDFATRAESRVTLPAGRWTLIARADDGLRVWADGALLLDEWRSGPRAGWAALELSAPRRLALRVEHIDTGGIAWLHLWLHPDDPTAAAGCLPRAADER